MIYLGFIAEEDIHKMTVHTMESVLSYCMEWMCFLPRGKNEPLRCCVFELHRIDVKMYCIENVTYVMKICIENEIMNHVLHVHHNWLNCVGWKFHEWMNRWRHKHIHLVLPDDISWVVGRGLYICTELDCQTSIMPTKVHPKAKVKEVARGQRRYRWWIPSTFTHIKAWLIFHNIHI